MADPHSGPGAASDRGRRAARGGAPAASRPGRPEPDWLIERSLSGRDAVYVHVGGCWNAGKRSKGVTREQTLHALAEGARSARSVSPTTRWDSSTRRCAASTRTSSWPRPSRPAPSARPSSSAARGRRRPRRAMP
ncbi:DUF6233 domain-containing protein [Streptomyces coeruleorubidus]|uniref:DUF6233 domain-containing protein n=1 Tax=Streptomyces coeruleorubidus TaxID=116188 RepID=UPI00378C6D7D